MNKWTMALAAAGVVSLSSVAQAQEAAAPAPVHNASVDLSGYVASSYTASSNRSGKTFRGTDANSDKFSLDVVSLTLSDDKGEGEWAAGYSVTLWMGPAAADIGTGTGDDTQSAVTGDQGGTVELMEAYIDLNVAGVVELKVGQFGTVVGYETYNLGVDDDGDLHNVFFNRGWAFAAEPTHHTGILAEYQAGDLGLWGGIANDATGANINASDDAGAVGYLLKAEYAPEGGMFGMAGMELTGAAVLDMGADGSERDSYYAALTLPTVVTGMTAALAADWVDNDDETDTEIYQLYLGYEINDDVTINARYEWGVDDITSNVSGLEAFTLGVTYGMWDNVSTRLEYSTADWDGAANDDEALTLSLVYNF